MTKFLEAVGYLYRTRPYNTMKLGLFRIKEMLARLGNPHLGAKFFHVTGSNGKGSVTTFLEFLTFEHGAKVTGFYSPHLSTILERFHVDTEPIDEDTFVKALEFVKPVAESLDGLGAEFAPSFFEFVTAMYFHITMERGAEYGSLEVGLGGRFDATNVVTPQVSVITTISLEHTNVLGDTVEQIAFEKAGIVKEGRPVVLGDMPAGAKEVIKSVAKEKNARIYEYGRDFYAEPVRYAFNENVYNYHGERTLKNIIVRLNGPHQAYNLACALKAFEIEFGIEEKSVRRAFERAFIPGRFENVRGFILDGAHNPQAAQMFVESVELYFPGTRRAAVFGILDDKDKVSVLKTIGPKFDHLIVTRPPSRRAQRVEETYEIAKAHCKSVELVPRVEDALESLERTCADVKFVTGSFYLVGYVRSLLLNGSVSEELALGGA